MITPNSFPAGAACRALQKAQACPGMLCQGRPTEGTGVGTQLVCCSPQEALTDYLIPVWTGKGPFSGQWAQAGMPPWSSVTQLALCHKAGCLCRRPSWARPEVGCLGATVRAPEVAPLSSRWPRACGLVGSQLYHFLFRSADQFRPEAP